MSTKQYYLWQIKLPLNKVSNIYNIHSEIFSRFTNVASRPFIFRQETDIILVRSRIKPLCEHRTQQYSIGGGSLIDFRVRCNTRRAKDGKKHTIRDYTEKIKWLERHLSGAALIHCRVDESRPAVFIKEKPGIINYTDFSGRLRVVSSDLFFETLVMGIGPSKSLGCGMLMVMT